MKRPLAPAGAPPQALAEIENVVQACAICRRWHKPTDKAIAAYRLVFTFKKEVHMDLVVMRSQIQSDCALSIVLYMVDVASRWVMA